MKFANQESRSLVKVAAAHRRIARAGQRRLRTELRNGHGAGNLAVVRLVKHIDANRRCSADDFAMAREVAL